MDDTRVGKLGEMKRLSGQWMRQHIFYIVVFIASFIVLVFFPMIGSSASGWIYDSFTASDWCFYLGTKFMIAILNFTIFYAFCRQGELNVRDTPSYKKAVDIIGKNKPKEYIPMAPGKWKRKQLLNKGLTLSISSLAALFVFTDIVLHYDWLSLISYAITILMAIIFGLIEMSVSEDYWSKTFLEWAIYQDKHKEPDPEPENEPQEVQEICLNTEIKNSEISKNKSEKTNRI